MKKLIITMALMAMAGIASAQNVRYIYIPGDGEHRLGLVLGPSFGQKEMSMSDTRNSSSSTATINSSLGFDIGIRWGYETEWGRTIEWGNHTALMYSMVPFSGEYTVNGGANHEISYLGQAAHLYESPNMVISLSDQLKLTLGIGLDIRFAIPGKTKVDGQTLERVKSSDNGDLLVSILNISAGFDGNVGCKYFITDEMYVGGRLQYNFYSYSFMDMENDFDGGEAKPESYAGMMAVDMANKQSAAIYVPKPMPVQLMFEVGYRW